jgi:CRP/FNR family cyclic AMP-dependent transcriptional regulator
MMRREEGGAGDVPPGDGRRDTWLSERGEPPAGVVELLRCTLLFEGLKEEDLKVLACRATPRSFKAGEIIFNQGDPGKSMFIVSQGHVNIHLPGEASQRVSLKDLARGEYFGELALFGENRRSASVLATTDAVLIEVTHDTLVSYIERRPGAAMAILGTMAARLRETNSMLSDHVAKNSVKEVEEKLGWTQRLADRVAELNGSWTFILILLAITIGWTVVNLPGVLKQPFDAYPYVFFNLLLAILVALQGPLIVMSQNRQSLKDRARSENDFRVNLKNEVNIETLLRELGEFRAETGRRLDRIGDPTGA